MKNVKLRRWVLHFSHYFIWMWRCDYWPFWVSFGHFTKQGSTKFGHSMTFRFWLVSIVSKIGIHAHVLFSLGFHTYTITQMLERFVKNSVNFLWLATDLLLLISLFVSIWIIKTNFHPSKYLVPKNSNPTNQKNYKVLMKFKIEIHEYWYWMWHSKFLVHWMI